MKFFLFLNSLKFLLFKFKDNFCFNFILFTFNNSYDEIGLKKVFLPLLKNDLFLELLIEFIDIIILLLYKQY